MQKDRKNNLCQETNTAKISNGPPLTIILHVSEVDIEMNSYHPSYGCGYVNTRSRLIGYQRCYHRFEGTVCEIKGIDTTLIYKISFMHTKYILYFH